MLKITKYLTSALSLIVVANFFYNNSNPVLLSKIITIVIILTIVTDFLENHFLKERWRNAKVFLIKVKPSKLILIANYFFALYLIGIGIYGCFDSNIFFQSLFRPRSYTYGEIHISFNFALVTGGILALSNTIKNNNICFEFNNKNLKISHPNKRVSKLDFAKNDYEITVDNQNIIFRAVSSNDILFFNSLNIADEEIDNFTNWVVNKKSS